MAKLDSNVIKTEMVMFARKNITDPLNRGTNTTQNFTGNGSSTTFQLTGNNVNLKHVSSLTVGGVTKTEFLDFTVEYEGGSNKGRITFTVAPANAAAIVVNLHIADTFVFPEFPRYGIKFNDLPRVIVEPSSYKTQELGIGATANLTDVLFAVTIYSKDTWEIDKLMTQLRTAVLNNKTNFQSFPFVTIEGQGPMEVESSEETRFVYRTLMIKGKFRTET